MVLVVPFSLVHFLLALGNIGILRNSDCLQLKGYPRTRAVHCQGRLGGARGSQASFYLLLKNFKKNLFI